MIIFISPSPLKQIRGASDKERISVKVGERVLGEDGRGGALTGPVPTTRKEMLLRAAAEVDRDPLFVS
jgi:hypothetical protein